MKLSDFLLAPKLRTNSLIREERSFNHTAQTLNVHFFF